MPRFHRRLPTKMVEVNNPGGSSNMHSQSDAKPRECQHLPLAAQSLTNQQGDHRATSFPHIVPIIPEGMGCIYHQYPQDRAFPMKTLPGSAHQLYFNRAHLPSCRKHETIPFPCSLPTPTSPEFNVTHHAEAKKSHQSSTSASTPYPSYQNRAPRDEDGRLEEERPETSTTNTIYAPPPPTSPQQFTQNRWHQAQHYRFQVHEPPQIDPTTDNTLNSVSQNAEYWVTQLTHALTNTQSVKDTPSSHALRMFLPNCYDPLLIEATARQIFTFLLDRCTHGFRGPASFNKALKPVRDLEADRFATCEERLRNVIGVLRLNKRVCKDVLYEDWKIRLLVNHPLGYDKDKDCQKGSNDQRRKRLKEEREKLEGAQMELEAIKMTVEGGKRKRVEDEEDEEDDETNE
ncbi:hypothetical protein DM02DRAFT_184656 [Periconia macrospinosa]|uniref:Uncharacterized protein n=1 Tax=Periconia macrospinosa TaxID=97972 RepID=A0A2V1D8Y8_9PLEO|nr:hypothetical protein DM02DRAFT_184656 [Periconia macrospinosa]